MHCREILTVALLGAQRQVQFEFNLVHEPTQAWTAHVAFIKDPTFQMAFQCLLGTEGFLDRWAVIFNRCYDYFEIRQPDDFQ